MSVMRRLGRNSVLPMIVTIIAGLAPRAATAAGPCYPREAIIAHLAERFGERPAASGVAQGNLVLLLSRPDGASWTILLLPPGRPDGGLACPVAAGEGWTNIPPAGPRAGERAS